MTSGWKMISVLNVELTNLCMVLVVNVLLLFSFFC